MSLMADSTAIELGAPQQKFIGLQHYFSLVSDSTYHKALKNTFVFTLGSILITIPFAFFLAHLLLASQRHLRPIFSFILIVPGITPPIVLSIMFLLFFHGEQGILNQFIATPILNTLRYFEVFQDLPSYINWQKDPNFIMIALIFQSVWRWTGFITLFFLCALQAIPSNLEEAIELEGASTWQKIVQLRIPACAHVFLFTTVYLLVDSIALFAGSYRLLGASGGTENAGLLLVSYVYQTGFSFQQFHRATAISLSLVPFLAGLILILFWRRQKADNS